MSITHTINGVEIPTSAPLTASSEIIEIIFARMSEMQTEIDNLRAGTHLQADALDGQAAIVARLSERLSALEDGAGVPPKITLPPSTVQHNPHPGRLRPRTKGQAFRDRVIAADEKRSKAIAERNNKPRPKGKK